MSETNLSSEWPVRHWVEQLTSILESMTEQRPENVTAASTAPDLAESLAWEQTFSIQEEPCFWIVTPDKTWFDLGRRMLKSAGLEQIEAADARNTFFEIVNQSLTGLGQALGHRLQQEVACGAGREITELPPELEWMSVQLAFQGEELAPLHVAVSAKLLATIEAAPAPQLAPAEAVSANNDTAAGGVVSKTFDVLLEVALPVSVSFGRSQMLVKDVLKLITGSIVELNRAVDDPVEVIVNNRVIARGEVVVVDGNYGVRIRQIASRQERLGAGAGSRQTQRLKQAEGEDPLT